MKTFEQENQTIRQFLLGQLPEEQVEKLEDRIFTEPDFAEEVQIVEGELIADQQAGRLSADENKFFTARYNATRSNQFNLEYEAAFHTFVCSKNESNIETQPIETQPIEIQPIETQEIIRPPKTVPAKYPRTSIAPGVVWHQFVFRFGLPAAYATVVIGLLFLTVLVWYLVSRQSRTPDLSAQDRRAVEAELARLNSAGASPESILSTVDLQIAHRSGGAMARITFNTTPDKVFDFRLNLAQFEAKKYRAGVFDDHRNDLFAVPDLSAQNTENGPQIRLLIPVNYLKPGDYQIDLSVANDAGGYDQVNSYAFRVADTRK
jgi:hypothetical protein